MGTVRCSSSRRIQIEEAESALRECYREPRPTVRKPGRTQPEHVSGPIHAIQGPDKETGLGDQLTAHRNEEMRRLYRDRYFISNRDRVRDNCNDIVNFSHRNHHLSKNILDA